MTNVNHFLRKLMIEANNYMNVYGHAPATRNAYVSTEFYDRICQHFDTRADALNGYKIMVVLNNDHPDYVICLR